MGSLTDCPACRHAVSTAASSCPQCGQPLGWVNAERPRRGFLAIIVLAVAVPAIVSTLQPERPRPVPPPVVLAPARPAVPPRSAFSSGDGVLISRPGGAGNTLLGIDEASFEAMQTNFGTFRALRDEGKVVIVENGTPAVVVEVKPGRIKVRIADRPHKETDWWVAAEFAYPWK